MREKELVNIKAQVEEIRTRRGRVDGGPGSGNWGHKGVHGQVGGSAPSGGTASNGASESTKSPEMHKKIESMGKDDVGDYLFDNGFDDGPDGEWHEWVRDKVISRSSRDEIVLKLAAKSVAAGKGEDFKRLSKANYWEKADYIEGIEGDIFSHEFLSNLAWNASHGSKMAALQIDTEARRAASLLDD